MLSFFPEVRGEAAMARVHAVSTGKVQKCGGRYERYCARRRGRVANTPPFAGTVTPSRSRRSAQGRLDLRVGDLRSDADADRHVGAFFLAIRNVGDGIDFQAAFYGRILVELEGHGLGTSRVLL